MCLDLDYIGLGSVVLGLCLGLVQIKPMFYFMSVQSEAILGKIKEHILVYYTNLPTGLLTISLTIEFITSVLYKISLPLLQALKSYPFFGIWVWLFRVVFALLLNK